jgi:hypothetical protein
LAQRGPLRWYLNAGVHIGTAQDHRTFQMEPLDFRREFSELQAKEVIMADSVLCFFGILCLCQNEQ